MIFVLLMIAAATFGCASSVEALFSTVSGRARSRGVWVLLVLGILGGGYLSVGLVYTSDTLRWYGSPLPVLALERAPGGDWVDYQGPAGPLTGIANLLFWLGLTLAPISIPRWWRRAGASVGRRYPAASLKEKALAVAIAGAVICTSLVVHRAVIPKHVIVLRNATAERIGGIGISCGRETKYAGMVSPGNEYVFECEETVPGPYAIWRHQKKIGSCNHQDAFRDRLVVTVSGPTAGVVLCEPLVVGDLRH